MARLGGRLSVIVVGNAYLCNDEASKCDFVFMVRE